MQRQGDRWLVNGEISAPWSSVRADISVPSRASSVRTWARKSGPSARRRSEFELSESQAAQCTVTGERLEL